MQPFCRTCLLQTFGILSSDPFSIESHKQLMFCIPEMNLRTFPDVKLCKECITILNVIYKFKTKCLEVEEQINKRQFNVTEHSVVTENIGSTNSIYAVCRTCFVDVMDNTFHSVKRPFYNKKLMFCVPEINLQAISDINLCNNCYIMLDKIYIFKTKCLDVERNITEYIKLHDKIDFRNLSVWCNVFVKDEVSGLEDYTIKQEEVDLVNEDVIAEVKDHITNVTFISQKTEELITYENCNCKNEEHLYNKSKTNSKHLKCDNNIVRRCNLTAHINQHADEKPFKCLLCEYSTARKAHLKQHIRIHTGEKPFKCSECEYSAVEKSGLNKHIRTHTGEKPFKCSLCQYSAVNKSTVERHIRTHTGEKPFKCSLCDYRAVDNSNLKNHIRTHTGEKPFKCLLCEYRAVNKSTVKRHIQTHTRHLKKLD